MKHDKWKKMLLFVPLALLLSMLLSCFIGSCDGGERQHKAPLIPATGWQVEAGTHTGDPMPAKVYQVKGHEIFFLRVGSDDSRWFSMDFSSDTNEYGRHVFPDDKVHVLERTPGKSPYLHYRTDGHAGVDILSGKSYGYWLSYTGDKVVFSNYLFFVSATQDNSGRPPVEVYRRTRGL